jgi:hypothetical protein
VSSYRETTAPAKSFGQFVRHLRLAFAKRALNLQTTNFNYQSTPMNRPQFLFFAACLVIGCPAKSADQVGPLSSGGHLTSTHQLIRPAGQSVEFGGRPVDLVASPDGRTVYVKDNRGLVVIDAPTWKVRQELKFSAGGSGVHGIVVTRDGSRIYTTTSQDILWEIKVMPDGNAELGRKLVLPGPGGSGTPVLAGLALSADEKTAYVCLSRNNSLGIVDLVSGKLVWQSSVGVAPYDVGPICGRKEGLSFPIGVAGIHVKVSARRSPPARTLWWTNAAWPPAARFQSLIWIRTERWRTSSRAFIRRTSS